MDRHTLTETVFSTAMEDSAFLKAVLSAPDAPQLAGILKTRRILIESAGIEEILRTFRAGPEAEDLTPQDYRSTFGDEGLHYYTFLALTLMELGRSCNWEE